MCRCIQSRASCCALLLTDSCGPQAHAEEWAAAEKAKQQAEADTARRAREAEAEKAKQAKAEAEEKVGAPHY